jgi:signal transduction histidine kinase
VSPPSSKPATGAEARETAGLSDEASRIAELEEALAARDDLIRLIGHELRNPLSPVYLQACHLTAEVRRRGEDGVFEGRWLSPRLERLQRGLERLLQRLNRVMDVAAIQSPGGISLDPEMVDLAAVAADVLAAADREASATGIQLRLHAPGPVVGRWDRGRVTQVIGSLVTNAIQHGGGAPVDVTVEARGEVAHVVVRDHGPGITPAQAARLFDRLDRLTPRPVRGGMGLGLWMVRQLCTAMGGTIALGVASGPGASLEVALPRGTNAANDSNGE